MFDLSSLFGFMNGGAPGNTPGMATPSFNGGTSISPNLIGTGTSMLSGLLTPKFAGDDGIINSTEGKTLGALKGASTGAALGSIVPGVGTLLGAGTGALLGGLFGKGNKNEMLQMYRDKNNAVVDNFRKDPTGYNNAVGYNTVGYNTPSYFLKLGGYTPGPGDGPGKDKPLSEKEKLKGKDYKNIVESTGIGFENGSMDKLFKNAVVPASERLPKINYGRYTPFGYFKALQNTPEGVTLTNTNNNPHNASTIMELLPYLRELNPGRNVDIKYTPKYKHGGNVPADYKVENNEVLITPPGTRAPKTDKHGKASKIAPNTYKFSGATHDSRSGGIGVKGGSGGFVFSDTLKVDASHYLKGL